jgi:hypothetical protein
MLYNCYFQEASTNTPNCRVSSYEDTCDMAVQATNGTNTVGCQTDEVITWASSETLQAVKNTSEVTCQTLIPLELPTAETDCEGEQTDNESEYGCEAWFNGDNDILPVLAEIIPQLDDDPMDGVILTDGDISLPNVSIIA